MDGDVVAVTGGTTMAELAAWHLPRPTGYLGTSP